MQLEMIQEVVNKKVLKINRLSAGGFLGLTGPLGPRAAVAADAAN